MGGIFRLTQTNIENKGDSNYEQRAEKKTGKREKETK